MKEKLRFPACDQILNPESNSLTTALLRISGKLKMLFLGMIFRNSLHAAVLAVITNRNVAGSIPDGVTGIFH
jgi:hypothetical protein